MDKEDQKKWDRYYQKGLEDAKRKHGSGYLNQPSYKDKIAYDAYNAGWREGRK